MNENPIHCKNLPPSLLPIATKPSKSWFVLSKTFGIFHTFLNVFKSIYKENQAFHNQKMHMYKKKHRPLSRPSKR